MQYYNNTNTTLSKQSNRIKKIGDFLEIWATISENDYDSKSIAFFAQKSSTKFDLYFNKIDNSKIPNGLNRNIKDIYNIFGNEKKEIYLNEWTIMSLNSALVIYNNYCKKGQTKVFDIAYRYLGMGHIEVLSCDLDSHLLFKRPDGGSSGHDREANFDEVINKGSSNYTQMFFTEWFYKTII
jgi:hypothetical protein